MKLYRQKDSIALPAEMFHRLPMKDETTISSAEFRALREAAISKNRLMQFLAWQRNRKIILTD